MERKYIKASEVADMFGVTRQTIRNWIDKGLLTAVKLDGCHYVTMASVKAIEDKYADVVVVEGALEAYMKKYDAACEEYKASVELLHGASAANDEIRLNKPRLTELIRVLFCIVRVGIDLRGERMIEMFLTGSDAKEVSEEFGVSPERVSQIVGNSLRILDYEGKQWKKLKEENEQLKEELKSLKFNVASLENVREQKSEEIEYNKVDVPVSILSKKLIDCNITVRSLNCLRGYEERVDGEWVYKPIETVGDLARLHKTDLLKMRNFGKKSLIELTDFLEDLGLEWGTNYVVNEDGSVVKAS